MTDRFKPFPCGECGGTVRMLPANGEICEFRRGVRVALPDHVLLPRCDRCGETFFSEEDSARVDAAARAVYLDGQRALYARCVEALQRGHGATLREIEAACGVTPTYFSHVMKGRRVASLTLTRLLEAFVASPGEFARHREGAERDVVSRTRQALHGASSRTAASVPRAAPGIFSPGHAWPVVPAVMQGAA
jgi:hypothetical protein